MAARFWVGGTGVWSNTARWSATSGGAGGASVPGTGDTATFNASSGGGTATVDSNVDIQTLTMTGFTGVLAFGTNTISVNSTGTVFTGDSTYSVTGTPVVNVTNTGATAITVTPGASITEANSISFNFTSGTYGLSMGAGSVVRNINFTGSSCAFNGTTLTIYGDLTLSSTMTITAGTSILTFASTSATPRIITSNGKTVDKPITFNGVGGTWKLADALTLLTTKSVTHTNGTLDLNGKTLTIGPTGNYATAVGTKNLTFNGGTLVCPNASTTAFNNAQPANFSTTAGTGTGKISMTGATAKTFIGGSSTFNCTVSNDGAGALTITGSNTFTTLANGVQPTTFSFTAGTTTTVTNFNVSGIFGSNVTIQSATAATHTLSKTSGNVLVQYVNIANSTATGGASWYAANSADNGGNTGWVFGLNKYWVGGTGNWSDAARWATTSGGAGGAGINPADAAVFNASSGGGTATVDSNVTVTSLTMTGYTGTLAFGTNTISLYNVGAPYTGAATYSVSGTPVINITYAGAAASNVFAGAVTEANSISFNFTAGTYILGLTGNFRNFNFTGFSGSHGPAAITIYGDYTLSPTMTVPSSANALTFGSTSATPRILTFNGVSFQRGVTFNGVGGTWQLADALTLLTTRVVTHTNGTLDLNGKTLTVGPSGSYVTAAGTKNLTFNGGTLVCPAATATAFNNAAPTGYTTTAGTGTGKISMTGGGPKTFVGGGSTYNCTLSNDSAFPNTLTITGSNTFTTIANGVAYVQFTFIAGTTTTVTNLNVAGTSSSNSVLMYSDVSGTPFTLSKASGIVSVDYIKIADSTATGGATWYAGANSADQGGNTGWIFTAPPVAYSITALNGTYTLNGQSIGIARNRNLSGSYGSYSVNGQSVIITRDRALSGAYGSYSITGQTASIARGRNLSGSYGSYSLTGQSAVITYTVVTINYTITANAGSYALTGQSAAITRDRSLTSDYGSYVVTGQTADISRSRALNSDYGVYALTGSSADLVFGRVLSASPGDYAVTGQDATLTKSNLLSAENGLYSLAGQAVNITYSGAPVETVTQYWIEIRSFTESRRI